MVGGIDKSKSLKKIPKSTTFSEIDFQKDIRYSLRAGSHLKPAHKLYSNYSE